MYKPLHDVKQKENYRNIFCYWENKELPILINECIKNIKKKMGNKWQVILLNKENVHEFIPKNKFPKNFEKIFVQAKADWIRLYLMKNYGGLWIDISIVLNDPQEIEDMYDNQLSKGKNLCMYEMNHHRIKVKEKEYPGLENWFIMAKPNNDLINGWFKEFTYAIEIGFDKYFDYIIKNNYIISEGCEKYVYLTAYRCVQVAMQKYNINFDNIYIKDAKESMYKIIENPYYIVKNKLKHNVKLASSDRKYLESFYLKEFIELYFV